MKNLNLVMASSAALLGLFVGLKGNDLAKLGGVIAVTGSTAYGAGLLSARGKLYNRAYESEKLVKNLGLDKIKQARYIKSLEEKSEGFLQTMEGLKSDIFTLSEGKETLANALKNALGQAARNQVAIGALGEELALLKAEKQQLVEELDETLEELTIATEGIDEVVSLKVSEETAQVHERYKTRMNINVEKLATGRFNVKSKALLERVEGVTVENENLRKELDRYEVEFREVQNALSEEDPFDFSGFMGEHTNAYQVRITELTTKIEILEAQLLQATMPQKFPSARDYEPGNKVINFVWNSRQIPVDGVFRAVSGTNETFYFQLRSTKDINAVRQCVNGALEDLRIATGVKQLGAMEWDTEKALLKLSLTNHVQIIDTNAINRLWVTRERFPSLVSDWQRIRITGASEGAKSPLARNILGAKLLTGEKFDVIRYDPSGGSKKDYWRLEADATTIEGLPPILKQMREDATGEARKLSKDLLTRFYVIDEIDVSFKGVKDPKTMSASLEALGKHGSHTAVGCILCGQNANVSTYPGFQRSDMNSFVSIHIGSNINDALTNSNDPAKVTELYATARTLLDYCSKQNEGVDFADRMQVALVEEPGKRYFIQLPKLGEFGFDKISPGSTYDLPPGFSTADYAPGLRSLNQAILDGKSLRMETPQKTAETLIPSLDKTLDKTAETPIGTLPCNPPNVQKLYCPHCESDKLRNKGADRYQCKNCNKSFMRSKALGGK